MSNTQTTSSSFKITPGDLIFTFFRHTKKIVFFGLLGIGVGAAVYSLWPTEYQSSAKLMIRFVTEDRGISDTEQDTRVVSYGGRGTGYIINGELAILTSLDLAERVAEDVGPEEIADDPESTPTVGSAAGSILKGLSAVNPRGTNMVNLSMTHPNRDAAQKILTSLIENYQIKHLEIHRGSDTFDEYITRETDQMRLRLQQTEQELNAVKAKADIFNIDDSKQRLSDSMTQIRQETLLAQTEIAELETFIAQQEGQLDNVPTTTSEEESVVENQNEFSESEMENAVREYASLAQKLDFLKNRERQLSLQYTDENSLLKVARKQISDTTDRLTVLVRDYPGIRNNFAASMAAQNPSDPSASSLPNLQTSKFKLVATKARLERLNALAVDLRKEAGEIDSVEITLNELERRKALQESKYSSLLESMERARVQEELGDGRINNIGIIQAPSPAFIASNKRLQFAAGTGAGVALIGIIWALLIDLLIDRSIKRPTEIQRNLGIPLFMSFPDLKDKKIRKINSKANRHALQQAGKIKQLEAGKSKDNYQPKSHTLQAAALTKPEDYGNKNGAADGSISPWDDQYALSEHFEALRDRVITYFESKNLTHKPKLIGMTGLGQGSGVTTIASGLAGSLSKIDEGSVLLVDMTLGQETAQQFYKGKSILNLDDVLNTENEGPAKMQDNLYVVAEGTNGAKLPRIMPQRFNKIMPKLRASDFDYIIFDMPPVSAISSTPRLASFMDVVLMVMESEETNRNVANQALELLAESKAHLGGILNKTKSHIPHKLEQDLLSQA